MSFSTDISISLGLSQTGLTLKSAATDGSDTLLSHDVTGTIEEGSGLYGWSGTVPTNTTRVYFYTGTIGGYSTLAAAVAASAIVLRAVANVSAVTRAITNTTRTITNTD